MAEASSPTIAVESQPSIPSPSSIVSINVGGKLFQTTTQTLSAAGAGSLLATLPVGSISFFDRDPSLFSSLLSLLRTSLPPANPSDLLPELHFFSIDPLLLLPKFDPFSLQRSLLLPLHGRDHPSALAAGAGSIHVGHGGKITTFDSTLSRRATVLTPLPAIDSLLSISPSLVAAGASDFPSVHLINIPSGHINQTLDWSPNPLNPSPPAVVQAITSSPNHLFASFESSRRTSSAIVAFDLSTFTPAIEIGRGEIYGAELDSAIPATKLKWVESFNLLMAAGSHAGPSGLTGNLRLFDVRSGAAVWETSEKVDCFADVTVSEGLFGIFKVGLNSGEVFVMDLRRIGSGGESSWMCLGDSRKAMVNGRKEGNGCRIESYGNQVFVSRGEQVEMWSSVSAAAMITTGETVMKRNIMGRTGKDGRNRIMHMVFGTNRMVIARKDEHCVEVWESSGRNSS